MQATIRRTAILAGVSAVLLSTALTGCVPAKNAHQLAVEAARTSFDTATEGISDALSDVPSTGLREKIIEDGAFAGSASLIDADDDRFRAEADGLTGLSSYILDASQNGTDPTLLLYVSGYAEGGGGLSYERATAFTCVTVTMNLEARTLSYAGASCPDGIYAQVEKTSEIDLDELEAASPLK
ncbi:MAG: hypothetical protein JWP32_1331 [Schumannella sp.]|nr:hypothetical protein [Schumannella sp.]